MIIYYRTTIFHTRIKNTSRQDEYKTMQVLSIKEDKACFLNIGGKKENTQLYLPTIEKTVDPFRIVAYIMKKY
jgi:hypothetical protein